MKEEQDKRNNVQWKLEGEGIHMYSEKGDRYNLHIRTTYMYIHACMLFLVLLECRLNI